ncbi:Secreted protein containing C-terminal beta-propeller domain [Pseudobacteriovorax antillogorgiicola]|uniref:Secreted protein containing C-terminal beta-propeller domain n=2 Tax=Pseudobacteriovorax antillogorgiicola TaxID=1513793 RepID=A0A1Y6CVC2_9BACT|nr:putative secreted protein with C-terminal beta-propeller domain [Pseudobacteriovorax antillogorgiicola]SMF77398.1 Secreted protein containing C-terminal beta-propeller domain [Pseudobacteriovorax antillogorgiicola]
MKFYSKPLLCGLSLALGVACTDGGKDSSESELSKQRFASNYALDESSLVALTQFDGCNSLEGHLKGQYLRYLEERFAQQRVNHAYWLARRNRELPQAEEASSDMATEASEPQDFSKTNTQVEGVDEPDIVKTNGTHIFTATGNKVQIVKSWPAADMIALPALEFPGRVNNLFLTEDQKLVVSYFEPYVGSVYDEFYPYSFNRDKVFISSYDVSNPESPVALASWAFNGNYQSMRRIGSSIRLIQNSWGFRIDNLQTYIDTWEGNGPISMSEFDKRVDLAKAANSKAVAAAALSDILNTGGETNDVLGKTPESCQKVFSPEGIRNTGLTKVTTIELATSTVDQSAVTVPSNHVYASEKSLYITQSYSWFWRGLSNWETLSFVHRFDIQNPSSTQYLGSGSYSGYINNQFSMDEKDDVLRIAVTENIPSSEDTNEDDDIWWWRPMNTINRVITMNLVENKLQVLGKSVGLAEGEKIYSARFMGDKGYVVTFRQVDPLYTFDLTDPAAPKVVGELKIPGFSTYMHPLDEGHLLAVGNEATNEGRITGLKVSIFDVSDFANPKEKHKFIIDNGNGWNWSEALYDHHAFTYFASRKLLAIPLGGYIDRSWTSELKVFNIDTEAGISNRGSISMSDLAVYNENYGWWYSSQVRRSVFADDFIYGISNSGIRAVHNSDLAAPIKTVSFVE